jgi:hypothetical protein
MNIDEAWSENLTLGIDRVIGHIGLDWSNPRNATALYSYIRLKPGIAAAINDTRVPDHEVIRLRRALPAATDRQTPGHRNQNQRDTDNALDVNVTTHSRK